MPGRDTAYQQMARDAADSIDTARRMGEQLTLLPEASGPVAEADRPTRGPGKAMSQMREFLAAKGWKMPEERLAEMAGLASGDDAFLTAMVRAEQILAWAAEGAENRVFIQGKGHVQPVDPMTGEPLPWKPTPKDKIDAFQFVYMAMLRANDALMPYGAPKVTPDTVQNTQVTQIVMPQGAPQPRAGKVIEGGSGYRLGPPPLPAEMQQNQEVDEGETVRSDGEDRTE